MSAQHDRVAQAIRIADGNHEKGASELAGIAIEALRLNADERVRSAIAVQHRAAAATLNSLGFSSGEEFLTLVVNAVLGEPPKESE